MLPLLFKHYWKPIQLHDIPAIREDDGSAASIGAFRAYQARRDNAYAEKHNGDKRKRDLGLDLLRFFSPEISVQAVSRTSAIFQGTAHIADLGHYLHLSTIPPAYRSSPLASIHRQPRYTGRTAFPRGLAVCCDDGNRSSRWCGRDGPIVVHRTSTLYPLTSNDDC